MPSLPTSLIIVVLVAAWLVVLVPMVSKRREEVPEAEDGTANFRVLERRARRRQPVLARTARIDADGADGSYEADGFADESDGAVGGGVVGEDAIDDRVAGGGSVDDGVAGDGSVGDRALYDAPAVGHDSYDAPAVGHDSLEGDAGARNADAVAGNASRRGRDTGRAASRDGRAAARQRADDVVGSAGSGRRSAQGTFDDEAVGSARSDDHGSSRPEGRRTGRGGFDPRAAERARQERFHRRRRTALVLFVLALVGTGIGALGVGYGYVGAGLFGSLLVLYFAYLRRQVRIEEEIRHRRAARLERARQIRPNYRPSVAEQVWMHRTGETERPRPGAVPEFRARSHVRQTVPAAQYGHAVALDLDDSDPAFDDLAYYRPAARQRRAS